MFGIGDFFKKIQSSFAKEILIRTAIKDSIKKHTGADIQIENISIKSGVAYMQSASSGLKSAVYVKKSLILQDVAAKGLPVQITDLR